MLKGIDPVLSPDLLKVLCEMGHGDEIVFADAHYPAASSAKLLLRADGIGVARLLKALAPLFQLDQYSPPVVMSSAVKGDRLDPSVEKSYRSALGYTGKVTRIALEQFYARSRTAFAIVQTGETAQYGNIILRKGVVGIARK